MAISKQHLQKHGNQWRVRVKVPDHLRASVGKSLLVRGLHTADLKVADRLKGQVLAEFKDLLAQHERALAAKDPLEAEALSLRVQADPEARDDIALLRAEKLEETHGYPKAKGWYDLATGKAAPLDLHCDAFVKFKSYPKDSEGDLRRALRWLGEYLRGTRHAATVQAVTRKLAGGFLDGPLVTGRSAKKAAAYLGFLRTYWQWMVERGHAIENPWAGQTLRRPSKPSRTAEPDGGKRPFTDDELAALIHGSADPMTHDLMRIAALSGMRIEEICQLQVGDCADGYFQVVAGKTDNARRTVPIHSDLAELVARRSKGREATAFLFPELPEVPASRTSRSDPAVKRFTRYRRKMGVDERPNDKAKSNVDFHSFRRWFMRKARDVMLAGNAGFDEWTFPSVVGHVESERPKSLDLAMRGYAGQDPEKAKRALVEAVKLPPRPKK